MTWINFVRFFFKCFSLRIVPAYERRSQLKMYSDMIWLYNFFMEDPKARKEYFHVQVK